MTNILKQNLNKFRSRNKEMINLLESAFSELNVDFYLIGASSRDLWIEGNNSVDTPRATMDIDFAVYVKDIHEYEKLMNFLIKKGFCDTKNQYRLTYNKKIIDILPFGEIELGRKEVKLSSPPETLSVYGFEEVLAHSYQVGNYKVVTLPGLCIMKLISYHDRSDRTKDKDDMIFILENYSNLFTNELFNDNADLIDDDFDFEIAGAGMLGRDMKKILDLYSDIKELCISTLNNFLNTGELFEIDELYQSNRNDKIIKRDKLIAELIKEIIS